MQGYGVIAATRFTRRGTHRFGNIHNSFSRHFSRIGIIYFSGWREVTGSRHFNIAGIAFANPVGNLATVIKAKLSPIFNKGVTVIGLFKLSACPSWFASA